VIDQGFIERHTAEVPLSDGGRVVVRPITPDDREAMRLGFSRLSDASRRLRFFTSKESLSEHELDYLTNVDYCDHFAWVAFDPDEEMAGVGVARYVRASDDPTVAEPAVTVVDDHHRRGIGGILIALLAESAYTNGIDSFRAEVLGDNAEVLGGIAGIARVTEVQSGVLSFEIALPLPGTVFAKTGTYELLRRVAAGDIVPRRPEDGAA
jgi:GNAT superfamily N-acetyltransferase